MSDESVPFLVNLAGAAEQAKNLDLQIEALHSRIEKLIHSCEINDLPIGHYILGLTHKGEDLKKLGKVLERLGDLAPEMDELQAKKEAFKLAMEKPEWFMMAFGDFRDEIEHITERLERGDYEGFN